MNEIQIRPNNHTGGQVSFIWRPSISLAELVYDSKRGLRFAVRDSGKVHYTKNVEGNSPLPWLEPYARTRTLRLPTETAPYGSLDDLAANARDFIHRYFDCDPIYESVVTLFVLHTWVYERFDAVPYLRFLGPPSSGKSRGTQTIGALCYHPLVIAGSATAAAMFRQIEAVGGTVLIDEADYSDSQVGADIAKVLNCGYQQGFPVSRMEKTDDKQFVPRLYEVFGPKIINGRKRFKDDATESRCLPYTPTATARRDVPVQLPDSFKEEAAALQNQLLQWRFDTLDTIHPSAERVDGLGPRMNQIVLRLLTIADLFAKRQRDGYRSDLLQFARRVDQQAKDVGKESVEAAIVRVVSDFHQKGEEPICAEIAEAVKYAEAENIPNLDRWLTPRKVGQIVRDQLGFQTRHTDRGTAVSWPPMRLHSLEEKYGIKRPSCPAKASAPDPASSTA